LSSGEIRARGLEEVEWLFRDLVVELLDVVDIVATDADDVAASADKVGSHDER
jgi:hypothetical protein